MEERFSQKYLRFILDNPDKTWNWESILVAMKNILDNEDDSIVGWWEFLEIIFYKNEQSIRAGKQPRIEKK